MLNSLISPFAQYQSIFQTEGIELEIDDDAVTKIAENCFNADIGARGIKNHFDKILLDSVYDIEVLKAKNINKITINSDSVDKLSDPIYT